MSFKIGDLVFINQDVSKTHRLYTVNENMLQMKGKVFKIRDILNSKKIKVENWVWHPDDLTLYTPETNQKTEPVLYNVNNLDI